MTKQSRSCVWNAYFSVWAQKHKHQLISHSHTRGFITTLTILGNFVCKYSLTVRKGCLVFCSTRLSVTVCATSSWNTHKHTSVNSAITRENNTAVSWYLIGHDRSIYYSLVQSKRTLLLRYERTTATQRENMDTEPKKANKSQWGYKWLLIWTIYGNGIVNEEHHHFSQEKHQQPSISFYINIRKM